MDSWVEFENDRSRAKELSENPTTPARLKALESGRSLIGLCPNELTELQLQTDLQAHGGGNDNVQPRGA